MLQKLLGLPMTKYTVVAAHDEVESVMGAHGAVEAVVASHDALEAVMTVHDAIEHGVHNNYLCTTFHFIFQPNTAVSREKNRIQI